jgi:chitinase
MIHLLKQYKRLILLLIAPLCLLTINVSAQKNQKHVIIGYVTGSRNGFIDTTMIDAKKLTHINYAFVSCRNNRAILSRPQVDSVNFRYLVSLKKVNPSLKVLISIGGWGGCRYFSDAALSDTSRQAFAASAAAIIGKYNLDGVDIDWEYPDDIGAGNIFRSVDKYNYTLLFQALRKNLDSLTNITHHTYLLTAAVGGFKRFLQQTEMGRAQRYLDYLNLMTYDYSQDSLHMAIHHTNLYPSKKYVVANQNSVQKTVRDFERAGVPSSKLVVGIAFYGRGETVVNAYLNGLGSKLTEQHARGGGYTFLKDSLINQKGFKYYRDKDAKAPYLFNPTTLQFITFDDEWSVRNKCKFVVKHNLAGVMFWEYSSDKKEYLLKEIDKDLKY